MLPYLPMCFFLFKTSFSVCLIVEDIGSRYVLLTALIDLHSFESWHHTLYTVGDSYKTIIFSKKMGSGLFEIDIGNQILRLINYSTLSAAVSHDKTWLSDGNHAVKQFA